MLQGDDQSGVLTFLVGIVVLVLAGVGLSLLVDRRFSFSQGKAALETTIDANDDELAQLTARRDDSQARLDRQLPRRTGGTSELSKLTATSADLGHRLGEARRKVASLEIEIPKLEETFSRHREQYRQSEWVRAVGESLGNLTVRGGREYRRAEITQVTEVGLEIRHEDGIARLQAPDLPAELCDRFQWDDARRTKALQDERKQHEEITRADDPQRSAPPFAQPSGDKPPDQENLARLRADVARLKSRVRSLGSEHADARSQASFGAPSVPGSLETWSARASRLGAELAKARAALALSRERLATVSPGDSLLREGSERD
jgi:DNA repair exonuclease SbcCD ATPase subunit